jgi:hypothetical protein
MCDLDCCGCGPERGQGGDFVRAARVGQESHEPLQHSHSLEMCRPNSQERHGQSEQEGTDFADVPRELELTTLL